MNTSIYLSNNLTSDESYLTYRVPLGFLAPLPQIENPSYKENKFQKSLRKLYIVITLLSFCSELLAVMWATVAVNKLTETVVAPAESVWHLLLRDFDLAWAAVNSHFVVGMLGFMSMVGIRALFMVNKAEYDLSTKHEKFSSFGKACSGIVVSSLMLMVSIVNRGVQSGGGSGTGYGLNITSLISRYASLLWKQAIKTDSIGILEFSAIAIMSTSIFSGLSVIVRDVLGEEKEELKKNGNKNN